MAGTAVIGWRTLVPVLRTRHRSVLRPLLPAPAIGTIEDTGLVALAWAARSDVSGPTPAMLSSVWVASSSALVSSASGILALRGRA